MKEILNKRFDSWSVIWILVVMVVQYGVGKIWDIGIGALLISVFLYFILFMFTEVIHKKRFCDFVNRNVKEFVNESETIVREYGYFVLEELKADRKVGKTDRIVSYVFMLNYYTRKLKELESLGGDKEIKLLTKSEKVWNGIKDEYEGKKQEWEYILTESAKLTWLMELIEKNKEKGDVNFSLQYKNGEMIKECEAERLVEELIPAKGQKAVFVADGGYGKTWTVERMARTYAERYVTSFWEQGGKRTVTEFPVLVNVGDINIISDKPIFNRMYEQLNEVFSLALSENMQVTFEISTNDVLFVDALDEKKDAGINTAIVSEINKYNNTAVFTTRFTDVACLNELTGKNEEKKIVEYYITDVDKEQVRKYLENELSKEWENKKLEREKVNTILEQFESSGFSEKCNSPFLLNCFINTVRDRMNDSKSVDLLNKKDLNELYGAFIVGIIKREREGKSLRGLTNVEEVLRYLNKFAVTLLEKNKSGLSGVEASELAREYFQRADFDGRDLKSADKDINVSLREIHIFTVENGQYHFISDDFRDAVIKEEQIDEMMNSIINTPGLDRGFLDLARKKLVTFFSEFDINAVIDILCVLANRGASAEQVFTLIGKGMYPVNLDYVQENADKQALDGVIRCLYDFERERISLHASYEKACEWIGEYITAWLIGRTKQISFSCPAEELDQYVSFKGCINVIQRLADVKRQVLSYDNLEKIINSYGDNDYPKLLWLKERFANLEYSMEKYNKNKGTYKYPTNLVRICEMISGKINGDFEIKAEVDNFLHVKETNAIQYKADM